VDVTSGNNSVSFDQGANAKPASVAGYPAGRGYDLVTGVGTVNAKDFVYELAASDSGRKLGPVLLTAGDIVNS
jgi:hypothetical protein